MDKTPYEHVLEEYDDLEFRLKHSPKKDLIKLSKEVYFSTRVLEVFKKDLIPEKDHEFFCYFTLRGLYHWWLEHDRLQYNIESDVDIVVMLSDYKDDVTNISPVIIN